MTAPTEPKHTPGPWELNTFTKPDGTPMLSNEDVAETLRHSALQSETAELWGVSLPAEDGLVICYTGNGPTSAANARLIAAAPALLDALTTLAAAVALDLHFFDGQPHKQSALGIARTAIAAATGELAA